MHAREFINGTNECICRWKRQVAGGGGAGWVWSRTPGVVRGGEGRTQGSGDGWEKGLPRAEGGGSGGVQSAEQDEGRGVLWEKPTRRDHRIRIFIFAIFNKTVLEN